MCIRDRAHTDCTRWLNFVIDELKTQINSHKKSLDERAETLMQSHSSADQLIQYLEKTEKEYYKLLQRSSELDGILLKLMRSTKFRPEKPKAAELGAPELNLSGFNQATLSANAVLNNTQTQTLN